MTTAAARTETQTWMIGAFALVLLTVGVLAVPYVSDRSLEKRISTPKGAMQTWLKAAESGDVDRIREAVAPSQRDIVDPTDPTGTGLKKLTVYDDELSSDGAGAFAADETLVELSHVVTCTRTPPKTGVLDNQPGCALVKGSGPDGKALVVRERGRWWAVAQPVRLDRSRQGKPEIHVVISSTLRITGGLTVTQKADHDLYGRSCSSWRKSSFEFDGFFSRPSLRLRVDQDVLPSTTELGKDGVDLSSDIRTTFRPTRPVPITRTADGSRGSLTIQHWVADAFFDDPVPGPIDGTLTWTCRVS